VPRKKELTLVAAKTPQLKKKAKRDWSKEKAASFLGVLAETCNVSEACRRSRVPMTVAYRQRKLDAAFRAAWVDAIGSAYSRLELMLLDRAFNGTEKVISWTRGDGIGRFGSCDRRRFLPYRNGVASVDRPSDIEHRQRRYCSSPRGRNHFNHCPTACQRHSCAVRRDNDRCGSANLNRPDPCDIATARPDRCLNRTLAICFSADTVRTDAFRQQNEPFTSLHAKKCSHNVSSAVQYLERM